MGIGSGYEHRYRVSVGDEPKEDEDEEGCRSYFLEVRTNFILKPLCPPGADEILMDTESFGSERVIMLADYAIPDPFGPLVTNAYSGKNLVDAHIRERLSQYCMPDAKIRALAQLAFDFVHALAGDPQYDSLRTIPVVLGVDVCTVQLEGEPLHVTVDRSIKPDFLIPLQLRWILNGPTSDLQSYVARLPIMRVTEEEEEEEEEEGFRVESCPICLELANVCLGITSPAENYAFHKKHSLGCKDGLSLMEVCPICLRQPIVGANIASLPCKHAFHDHCVVRWLMKSNSCPVCRVEILFKKDYSNFLK